MRGTKALVLLRLPILVAVTASTMLLVDSQHGEPTFCSVGSGCAKVRMSPYSVLFGVLPLPVIGLAAFAILFVASLTARTRTRHLFVAVAATVGAIAAAVLIALQGFVVEAFCKWCMTVDVSALLSAGAAWFVYLEAKRSEGAEAAIGASAADLVTSAGWTAVALLGVGLPYVWSMFPVVPPLPEPLRQYAAPGRINVLSFTDFQCPYCRKLHPAIDHIRSARGDELHFTRFMIPLPGHPGAMPAARAFLCVPAEKQDEMAERLYGAPPRMLVSGTADIATSLGVERSAFDACIADPATQAKIDHDIDLFKSIEGGGLPLTYVNERSVVGANAAALEKAFSRATQQKPIELPIEVLWVAMASAIAAATALTLRRASAWQHG